MIDILLAAAIQLGAAIVSEAAMDAHKSSGTVKEAPLEPYIAPPVHFGDDAEAAEASFQAHKREAAKNHTLGFYREHTK